MIWLKGAANGDVLIDGATIVATGEVHAPEAQIIDCAGAEVGLGDVCAHTHLYSGLVPLGMPAPEPAPENFLQILERVWWRLDRALDEASLRAGAELYIAEALLAGTTTLIDHHESPNFIEGSLDVLADALHGLGARGLVCYGATERNGGLEEGRRGLAECARFINANTRSTVRGAVALHASFTVSGTLLREAGDLCRALDTVLHIHLAEDEADIAHAHDQGYGGPLQRLLASDALPSGSLLAHGIHLGPVQVRRGVRDGGWFIQNPRSNRGNGVGYPSDLVVAEARVALGTDGYPAVMADELTALAEHGEPPELGRGRLDRGQIMVGELFGGVFDTLAVGTVADLVVRGPEGVRHVLVNGDPKVLDGALVHGDLAVIRATAQIEADGLWARMARL
jgi:cytosine/adenosine deaminase-related metal-dependent hydrolase